MNKLTADTRLTAYAATNVETFKSDLQACAGMTLFLNISQG